MGRLILKAPQLNSQISITSMAIHDSKLWGGTGGNFAGAGRLFQWDDSSLWLQKALAYHITEARFIYALLSFDGDLFGGSWFKGYLLVYDSVGAEWDLAAGQYDADTYELNCLIEFGGNMYAGEASVVKGELLVYNSGASQMDFVADYPGAEAYNTIHKLVEHEGTLWGCTGFYKGLLLKWDGGNDLDKMAILPGIANIQDMIVFEGDIYGVTFSTVGSYPGGELVKYNSAGAGSWDQAAPQFLGQTWVYALAVWNGAIWGISSPDGYVVKWNGSNAWLKMADTYGIETGGASVAVYNDRLFFGSIGTGLLLQYAEGQMIVVKMN